MKKSMQGFTLSELLISLALVSLLFLGFITTYFQAKQSVQNGLYRARAVAIAENLIARISSVGKNTEAVLLYLQHAQWQTDNQEGLACHQVAYPCTTKQMVSADIEEISYYLTHHLPNGNLQIMACNGSLCLTITWLEAQADTCQLQSTDCLFMRFNMLS